MNKRPTKEMHDKDIKVHAWDIIRLIPDEELARIAESTKVDYCSKVLSGERMFYLLLYCLIKCEELSLRTLSKKFSDAHFQALFNVSSGAKVAHSSLSDRLSSIDLDFFRSAYELMYDRLSSLYTEKEFRDKCIVRIDSTMVAETCNKLRCGMTVGKKAQGKDGRRQVKYTMGFDGFAVLMAGMFDSQSYLCEDVAMREVLDSLIVKDKHHRNLYVLDRGFNTLEGMASVGRQGAKFVGRIKTSRRMEVQESLMADGADRDLGALVMDDDIAVHLYDNAGKRFCDDTFRVIKAHFKVPRDTTRPANKGKVKRVENEVYFITNDFDLTPQEVAQAYRWRWDIEIFFRFLKQNMSFSHLISTNENGIQVVMYMTLIAAMLIMIYKRENEKLYNGERLFGYKAAKQSFDMEISDWITQLNIIMSGGDPRRIYRNIVVRTRIP